MPRTNNAKETRLWRGGYHAEHSREKALQDYLFINQHPMYKTLRGHPGFQAIVRKLGL